MPPLSGTLSLDVRPSLCLFALYQPQNHNRSAMMRAGYTPLQAGMAAEKASRPTSAISFFWRATFMLAISLFKSTLTSFRSNRATSDARRTPKKANVVEAAVRASTACAQNTP